jgi:hypothetical protein
MRLTKIDLTQLVAISHTDDHLGLLIDRGNDLEYLEIPAPVEAYEGLQELDSVIASEAYHTTASLEDAQLPESEIAMLPANSSMAKAVGYDHDRNLLQVEFRGGSVYQYEDVDEETWEALQESRSTGQFFNREIKGSYQSRRLH